MKITRISVWQRDLPLEEPYFLSGGRLRFDQLDTTFVRLETDAGVEGWGEACPWGIPIFPPMARASVLRSKLLPQPCSAQTRGRLMR